MHFARNFVTGLVIYDMICDTIPCVIQYVMCDIIHDVQDPRFSVAILPNSVAQFVKFHGIIIPKYPTFRGQYTLLLTYKEFVVTCNTKTRYSIFVHINIIHAHHVIHVIMRIIIIKVSLQRLDFIVFYK